MKNVENNKILSFLKNKWGWILAAILIAVVAISTFQIYEEEVLKIDPDIEYKEMKTLYFVSEPIDSLNPIISQSEDVYYISKLIYSSLFDFDENMNVTPVLVDKYSVNTDRAYIDITLKKNVKWHNGGKLKAQDIRYTIDGIKNAGTKSPYYENCKKIISVSVMGDYDFRIYFANNYNCALDDLTFPILPQSQYNSGYRLSQAKDNFKPIGSGQYRYSSYDYLKYLKLKSFKNYFGVKATNRIQINIIPDGDLASSMTEINAVTCYVDNSSKYQSIASDKNLKTYNIISNKSEFIVFNTRRNYTRQKEFRKAVCFAINSQKILDNAYTGEGVLTDTIYYPNYLGVEDTGEAYSYNPEKTKGLLKQCGIYDRNGDGIAEDIYQKQVTVNILVNKKNPARNAAAKIIEKNLQSSGIEANIMSLSYNEYKNAIARGDFDLLITGYSFNEQYDLRNLFNGRNEWKYNNYILNSKAREMERLYTIEDYSKKYKELKNLMLDEMPYYPLCYRYMGLVGISSFEAEKMPQFNNIYNNCNTWKWSVVDKKTETEEENSVKQ